MYLKFLGERASEKKKLESQPEDALVKLPKTVDIVETVETVKKVIL